ncbi:MAG TPA: hypothetical protein VMD53_02230 [Rhizomicrobium sp.]|nr:hypothetical protein [Rhizomicrobium sp.]
MLSEGSPAPKNRSGFPERSDAEILEQLKRSQHAVWFVILSLMGCLVASGAVVFAGYVGAVPPVVGEYFGAATLIVWFLAVFLRLSRRINPPPEANEERILRKRIDALQSRWRLMAVFFVLFAFTTTFSVSRALEQLSARYPALALLGGSIFVFVILLYALVAFYGPRYLDSNHRVINDELSHALLARALKAGYLLLMFMVGGVLLAILYRPALAVPVLCWALFAGFAMPTLYYVILQWRTGSGG